MRQKWKYTQQDGEGLANLGTKAAQQAQERVGQEATSLLLTLPVPLAGPRHPSGHFPTSLRAGRGRGQP